MLGLLRTERGKTVSDLSPDGQCLAVVIDYFEYIRFRTWGWGGIRVMGYLLSWQTAHVALGGTSGKRDPFFRWTEPWARTYGSARHLCS